MNVFACTQNVTLCYCSIKQVTQISHEMKRRLILLALVIFSLPVSGQVHKCDVGDHVVYQDFPCAQGETPLKKNRVSVYQAPKVIPFSRPSRANRRSASPRPGHSSAYSSDLERRNAEARAHARGYLTIGMTRNLAITILGKPRTSKPYIQSSGERCQNFYWPNPRFVSGSHRAVICDDKVVSYRKSR